MMMTKRLSMLLVAAVAAGATGCASMTNVRYGQLTTGGFVAAVTKPGLSVAKADEGFGLKIQIGHLQFGATTTHDPEASHLALGIESSTGFDNEENTVFTSESDIGVGLVNVGGKVAIGPKRITLDGVAQIDGDADPLAAYIESSTGLDGVDRTLVTSASRIGAGPASIGGELAIGPERTTLSGAAKIGKVCPQAIYGDQWTGPTAKYKPFPEMVPVETPDAFRLSKDLLVGPVSFDASLDIHEWKPTVWEYSKLYPPWFGKGTIGPFTLDAGANWADECSNAFGCSFYIGLADIE